MAKKQINVMSGFMKSDVSKMIAQGDSFGISNIDNPFTAAPKVENTQTTTFHTFGKPDQSQKGPLRSDMVGGIELNGIKTSVTDLVEIYRQRLQNIRERIATPGRPQATSLFMNRV